MSKRDKQAGNDRAERAFNALRDTLQHAAQNADALDLKPEVKAWLLDQFDPSKANARPPFTDQTLENVREIVRQQLELEQNGIPERKDGFDAVRDIVRQNWEQKQQTKPTSGKDRHAEKEQRQRKSKQGGDDLPPH